jgi:hypothetical protein
MDRKNAGYVILLVGLVAAVGVPDYSIIGAALMVAGLLLAFS